MVDQCQLYVFRSDTDAIVSGIDHPVPKLKFKKEGSEIRRGLEKSWDSSKVRKIVLEKKITGILSVRKMRDGIVTDHEHMLEKGTFQKGKLFHNEQNA